MIRLSKNAARLSLPRSAYSRGALDAAALVVGESARALVSTSGRFWAVELGGADRGALRRAAQAFLDEALAHEARRAAAKEAGPFAAAARERALERGFTPMPADPLEQLEPQVAEDRAAEIARLLKEAGA